MQTDAQIDDLQDLIMGQMRFKKELSLDLKPNEIESQILELQETKKWIENKEVRKVIVVPGKIVNIVVS